MPDYNGAVEQSGFNLIGGLLTGDQTERWGSVRLVDQNGDAVFQSGNLNWESSAAEEGSGIVVEATILVDGASIGADVHSVEVLGTEGTVISITDTSLDPIPAGQTTEITVRDYMEPA